jgi:hypothetical protein
MKRVSICGTSRRVLIVVASVAASLTFAATANAQVLAPGATIQFAGQFTDPTPVLVAGDPFLGCPSQQANLGLVNCKFFTFEAAATGTVTFTFDAEDGLNFLDAAVHCNGEPVARIINSSNAGEPMTVEFPVNQGDVCEIRVSIFLAEPGEATPLNPLTFTGTLTLNGAAVGGAVPPPVNQFKVTGGGQVDPNASFTSNAKAGSTNGLVRYFDPTGCKFWSTQLTSVSVTTTPDGGVAVIDGVGKLQQGGTTTSNVPFHARAEDHGEPGAGQDRFSIDVCNSPQDNPIDSGNIQIHPV